MVNEVTCSIVIFFCKHNLIWKGDVFGKIHDKQKNYKLTDYKLTVCHFVILRIILSCHGIFLTETMINSG